MYVHICTLFSDPKWPLRRKLSKEHVSLKCTALFGTTWWTSQPFATAASSFSFLLASTRRKKDTAEHRSERTDRGFGCNIPKLTSRSCLFSDIGAQTPSLLRPFAHHTSGKMVTQTAHECSAPPQCFTLAWIHPMISGISRVVPPPSNSGNEGLGWDSLLKME